MLAEETPAAFVAFDLLAEGDDDLREHAVLRASRPARGDARRRAAPPVYLTPATTDPEVARDWFGRFEGAGLDGVVAKPLDRPVRRGQAHDAQGEAPPHRRLRRRRLPHAQGRRGRRLAAARSVRRRRHAAPRRRGEQLRRAAAGRAARRARAVPRGRARRASRGASGPTPPRTRRAASRAARAAGPAARTCRGSRCGIELVAEVAYEHLQGDRFRHTARFQRWRPDREPASCTYAQLESVVPAELRDVFGA